MLWQLHNAFVIVVGIGGVGSHCAHMLARSGVGHMRFIDFDQAGSTAADDHHVVLEDVGLGLLEV